MMRRHLFVLALLMSLAVFTSAQSTTLSGTVTDAGAQTWNNGTFNFQFVPGQNNQGQYTWTGGTLPLNIAGVMNGSGAYSVSIPSNTAITPGGTSWKGTFCPQATSPCYTASAIIVTGATMTFNVTPPAISISLISPPPGPMLAYSDAEISSAAIGSFYYNLPSQGYRVCQAVNSSQACTTWAPLGSSAGSGFSAITSGTNTIAAMLCGTGCSLGTTGSGTIAATTATTATNVPFGGVTAGTNTAALLIGTGGSLGTSGTGTIAATSVPFPGVGNGTSLATLVIGTGGSLTVSGSGTNNATSINGVTITGAPFVGQAPVATSGTTAVWSNISANAVLPAPATAVQYASGSCAGGACSDTNNGLSWGTAKLSIMGALNALPNSNGPLGVGSGTVYVGPGAISNPAGSQYGIWIMSSSDPNYASPPTGWYKCIDPGTHLDCIFNIIGVPNAAAGPNGHTNRINTIGGSSADRNHPGLWITSIPGGSTIQNLAFGGGRAGVLGECSDNSRTNTCGVVGMTFINDGFGANQTATNGPALDITGYSYWLWFRDGGFSGNAYAATGGRNADNAAGILMDGRGNNGQGLIYITDPNFAGGGLKNYAGSLNIGGLYMQNAIEEGDFVHDIPPLAWFVNGISDSYLISLNVADSGPNGVCTVQNDGGGPPLGQPGPTVLNIVGAVCGPAVSVNGNSFDIVNSTVSPLVNHQAGFFNDYIVGNTDVARRIAGLVPQRFASSIATNDSSTWSINSPGTLITPGQLDPFGGTKATQLVFNQGSTFGSTRLSGPCVARSWSPGDWEIGGAMVQGSLATQQIINSGCNAGPFPTVSASYGSAGMQNGNVKDWKFIWYAFKVASANGSTNSALNILYNNNPINVYGPVQFYIPAGTMSDNEVLAFANSMASTDAACAGGAICNITGHPLQLAPDTFATLGTPPNGTFRFCSNCLVNSNPCAGSGTGAFAQRINGAWSCGSAGGGGGGAPAGAVGQLQTNAGGVFGASSLNDNGSVVVGTEELRVPQIGDALNGTYLYTNGMTFLGSLFGLYAGAGAAPPNPSGTNTTGWAFPCADGVPCQFDGTAMRSQVSRGGASGAFTLNHLLMVGSPYYNDSDSGIGMLNGDLSLGINSLAQEATTSDASYTVGRLACVTATNTVGNCTSLAATLTNIGVLLAKDGSSPVWTSYGTEQALSFTAQSWTAGDIVCADQTNFGYSIDNGMAACGTAAQVGTVKVSDTSVLSHTVILGQSTGGSTGGGTGLPTINAASTGKGLTNNGSISSWSNAYRDCSGFAGSDDAAKISACMAGGGNSNTAGGLTDARGLTGGSWATNPFDGIPGTNMSFSGILLMPCGTTTIKYGPIMVQDYWTFQGCTPTFGNGGYGTHLVAGATFPNGGTGKYGDTGTGLVTVGTAGANEIVTLSTPNGDTWTDNVALAGTGTIAKHCLFLSPKTQPVAANSTFGIIKSIDSTTQVTLAFGQNNGTGAPAGSSYEIACPLVLMMDGSATGQASYNVHVQDMELDANNIAGVIPLVNWFSQQSSWATNVSLRAFCGVAMSLEGTYLYQSGPYHHISTNPGSCNDGTSPNIVIRPNGASFFGLQDISLARSAATGAPTTGVDLAGFGTIEITGVDSEGPDNGVTVGGAFACKPFCVQHNRSGLALRVVANIDNVYQSMNTSAVHLSSANGALPNVILSNINGSGATNNLVDDNNSCTIPSATEGRLGSYQTDSNGIINYSTSKVAGCFPPVPATFTFFCTGVATSSASIIPFPFNGSATPFPCTNTTTIGGSFPLANSCTLRNLQVHAGTGSFAGTDTVKVVNNGGATTISATIPAGPGAQNGSDTTHTSAYVAGNGIRILITTGATDTLADVSGTFQCN